MTNTSQCVGWKNLSYNHLGDLWRCFDAGTLMAWHHALFAKAGGVTARRFHSAPGFAPLRSEDFRLMNQNIAESLRRLYSRSAIRNIKELVGPLATCRCEASIKSGGIEAILVWIPSLDSAVHTFWSHDLISNCLNKLHVPYCHSTLWRNVHILYDCVNNIATSCNTGNNKHTHIIYLLYTWSMKVLLSFKSFPTSQTLLWSVLAHSVGSWRHLRNTGLLSKLYQNRGDLCVLSRWSSWIPDSELETP